MFSPFHLIIQNNSNSELSTVILSLVLAIVGIKQFPGEYREKQNCQKHAVSVLEYHRNVAEYLVRTKVVIRDGLSSERKHLKRKGNHRRRDLFGGFRGRKDGEKHAKEMERSEWKSVS